MAVLKTKIVSSMEKVFPAEEPAGICYPLNALQGESVPFQLAIFPELGENTSYSHLDVVAEVRSSLPVTIRKVGYVPCELLYFDNSDGYYLKDTPGLFPDPLFPGINSSFRLSTGRWNSLFLEVKTVHAPAGQIPVTIVLKPRDAAYEAVETTVLIEVLGKALEPAGFEYTCWFHGDCLADYYQVPVFSEAHWQAMESQIRLAASYGQTMILTPLFTPPLDTAVGWERTTIQLVRVSRPDASRPDTYTFDFSLLDRFLTMAGHCGIRSFEMSHLFTQWGGKACPKIICEVEGEPQRIFGWETEALSPAYQAFLRSFLPALTAHLDARGLRGHAVFHLTDEPQGKDLPHYRDLRDFTLPLLDGYPVMDAMSEYEFFTEGVSSRPVVATPSVGPFLKDPRPSPLWVYYACGTGKDSYSNRFMDMPGARTRIIGLQCYLHRIDGFLQWGLNFYNSQYSLRHINPYLVTDADRSFPSGDAFVIYPGENGEAIPSQRLVLMGEAWQDYAALKMLEKQTCFSYVRNLVMQTASEHGFNEPAITFSRYPHGSEFLTDLRSRINREITRTA